MTPGIPRAPAAPPSPIGAHVGSEPALAASDAPPGTPIDSVSPISRLCDAISAEALVIGAELPYRRVDYQTGAQARLMEAFKILRVISGELEHLERGD